MEHYLAIDNVCAWPNLTKLADDTIIASIFNQPCHGKWEGDVESWASRDGGLSWQFRGTPAPHQPKTNRMNVAAGLARDQSLLVLASGWSKRNPIGQPSSPHDGEVLPIWVCTSTDDGTNWTQKETVAPAPDQLDRRIPFGDIIQLANHELGVCIYIHDQEHGLNHSHFYTSSDDGQSWQFTGVIRANDANETSPVVLPDGTVLALARTTGDQHLELFRSRDHGRTWEGLGNMSQAGQIPGHLLVLNDGRLLMSYGIRARGWGFLGIGLRCSLDQGQSWSEPAVLARASHDEENRWPASDGGYPATVQMADDKLVTAYYTSGMPRHQRYHMAVSRWKPEERLS